MDSKIGDIEIGVPQVSCLGPLLFLIYINDLPQAVEDSTVSMYADDTSLCYQSHDLTRLNKAINSDLKKLDTWLQDNKFSLNVAKTHSILISTKQKQNSLKSQNKDLDLKIRDNDLEVVKQTKYLGVQIDCSLNWKEQIKAVSSKVSRAVGFLRHAKSFLPKETLQTLYTGIVEPHFRYCCSGWGCAALTEINQLQKLQNRAARIITNSRFDAPCGPLIEEMGWKTIDELITCESKTMVFKVTLLSTLVSSELPFYKTTLLRKQLISPISFGRSKVGKKDAVLRSLGNRKIYKSQCFRQGWLCELFFKTFC